MRKKTAKGMESSVLRRLRRLCLGLPLTEEVEAWGHPTFRVDGSIFVGFGVDERGACMSFKATKGEQKRLVVNEPYYVAPYVGRFGWVGMRLDGRVDWDRVAGHVLDSYRLIAPKKIRDLMEGREVTKSRAAPRSRKGF